MAILANRVKIKNNLLEMSKFTIYSVSRFTTIIFLVFSCYCLYFSMPKNLSTILMESSGRFLSTGSLVYSETINSFKWLGSRLSYFKDLEKENLKLKIKIAHLQKTKRMTSDIQSENRNLREMLNVVQNVSKKFVTAKIIGISNSPFASSAMIQSGSKGNVKINDIVRGKYGLVGRVSKVSDNYATVMLLNDHNSRIPVITDSSKANGIIAKQGDNLSIIHLEQDHDISVGETIYTSGNGKIFPRGIPVAIVTKVMRSEVLVKIIENFEKMEYVVVESNL